MSHMHFTKNAVVVPALLLLALSIGSDLSKILKFTTTFNKLCRRRKEKGDNLIPAEEDQQDRPLVIDRL